MCNTSLPFCHVILPSISIMFVGYSHLRKHLNYPRLVGFPMVLQYVGLIGHPYDASPFILVNSEAGNDVHMMVSFALSICDERNPSNI